MHDQEITICDKCFWHEYFVLGENKCNACAEWSVRYNFENGSKRTIIKRSIYPWAFNDGKCVFFKPATPLRMILQHKWQTFIAKVFSKQKYYSLLCKGGLVESQVQYILVQHKRSNFIVFDVRLNYGMWPIFSDLMPDLQKYYEQNSVKSSVVKNTSIIGINHRQVRIIISISE